MSALPEFNPTGHYGYFGYQGACCDSAIRANRVDMLEECIERGYINKESKTLDGLGMVKYARKFGSEEIANRLIELGWDNEKWPHASVK